MKNTKTITAELLERWRAGEPGAAAELLFETGLWDELLAHIPSSQIDTYEEAILKVLDELSRRKKVPAPEQFADVFFKQARRRAKDLIIREIKIQGRTPYSLDEPWISGSDEGEEEPYIEHLPSPNRYSQPEDEFRRARALELTLQLLENFPKELSKTFQRHFQEIERAQEILEPRLSVEERAARLFEFLHVGRAHDKKLAELVIKACCGNRDTYDSAHNWRLRRAWRRFISKGGKGHECFRSLEELA